MPAHVPRKMCPPTEWLVQPPHSRYQSQSLPVARRALFRTTVSHPSPASGKCPLVCAARRAALNVPSHRLVLTCPGCRSQACSLRLPRPASEAIPELSERGMPSPWPSSQSLTQSRTMQEVPTPRVPALLAFLHCLNPEQCRKYTPLGFLHFLHCCIRQSSSSHRP